MSLTWKTDVFDISAGNVTLEPSPTIIEEQRNCVALRIELITQFFSDANSFK